MTDEEIANIRRERAKRELARRKYCEYLPYIYGKTWVDTRLSRFLAETVQKFVETETGNAHDIMIIETPPQHGKSMTVTEAFPSWYLGKYPDRRVIEVSYNSDTADRFGRRNKDKIEKCGKTLFGIQIGKTTRASDFSIAAVGEDGTVHGTTGQMISRGILSGVTGNPANLMLIDDPIKTREEADSETIRNKIWDEWLNSLKTRFAAGAKVILIMTPWHEDDLRARIMATEKNVTRIRIPVEAEEDDPLGRAVGEPLCPEIGKGATWLAQFKESYLASERGGARAWAALYQCNPVIEGGNIVQRSWWRYYDPKEITQFATEMISVDATFKDSANADFVSIQVWGKLDGNYYLRYCLNQRMNFPDTVSALLMVRALYPRAYTVLIEDKANGSAIIQTLQRRIPGIIGINPQSGKDVYGLYTQNLSEDASEKNFLFTFAQESAERFWDITCAATPRFARSKTMTFGSFDVLKNITKINMSMDTQKRAEAKLIYHSDYETREDLTLLDNTFEHEQSNRGIVLAVRVRRPKCRHIHQFAFELRCDETIPYGANLVSAQIFYTAAGRTKAGRRM